MSQLVCQRLLRALARVAICVSGGLIVMAQLQATSTLTKAASSQSVLTGQAYVEQAEPYLDFIRDHLWQKVGSGPLEGVWALAETEKPIGGDVWFWTDDNAKALEAYLVPEAYVRYQDIADSLLSFVRRMSEGPIILRRIAKPALNIVSDSPESFRLNTGLMNYHGNLRRDNVAISYRFHDGRDVDAVKLSGNWIRFDLDGRTHQFVMKDSIVSARLAQKDGLVILEHVSEFTVSDRTVARAIYSYIIDPALTRLLLDISIEALNGAMLADVKVTSAMDQLSDLPIGYQQFCGMWGGDLTCRNVAAGDRVSLVKGHLDWHSLVQLGNLGFSYAIYTQPLAFEQLDEVVAEDSRDDRFHRIYSVYGVGSVGEATPARIREVKLLTAGGLYRSMETYGDLIRNSSESAGIDFSASYDYGAELNAVGCYYMFAKSGRYEPARRRDDPNVVGLKDWFDRHLSMFEHNFLTEQRHKEDPFPYLFGRGIAFAILGVDCMYRATGEDRYLAGMKRMVDIILRLQRREAFDGNFRCFDAESYLACYLAGIKRMVNIVLRREGQREFDGSFRCTGSESYLDCQAAMILSLARASLSLGDSRLGLAVVDAINAIKMNDGQRPGMVSIWLSPAERDRLWGFKAGLLLRGLAAAEYAADASRITIDQRTRQYIRRLTRAATDYISASTVPRGQSLEILTSSQSGETNSESQPWMVLGLFPIDPIIAQIRQPGQAKGNTFLPSGYR